MKFYNFDRSGSSVVTQWLAAWSSMTISSILACWASAFLKEHIPIY